MVVIGGSTLLVVLLSALFVGCRGTRSNVRAPGPMGYSPEGFTMSWPAPPDPERVRYHREISGTAGLGTNNAVLRALMGNDELHLTRPYAVWGTMDDCLAVADPDLPGLVLYDARKGQVQVSRRPSGLVSPVGVCSDGKDLFYVADSELGRLLMFDRQAELVGTLVDGEPLGRPTGLCFDASREWIWVADAQKHRVFAFDVHGKNVMTLGGDAELNLPRAVAVGTGGKVHVVDALNCCVTVFDAESGRLLTRIGQPGTGGGDFTRPSGLAFDAAGNLYVADAAFNNVQIFSPEGKLLLVFGTGGSGAGALDMPAGLWTDAANRLYVCDSLNQRVQVFLLRPETTEAGKVTR